MQIILQEDVDKLGHRGDVVTVKPGYARNFILPRKLGIEATPGNMKALERIRTSLAKKTATELEAAQKQANLLNGVALKFARKTGENDQMFGSVTTADIAEGLEAQGPVQPGREDGSDRNKEQDEGQDPPGRAGLLCMGGVRLCRSHEFS